MAKMRWDRDRKRRLGQNREYRSVGSIQVICQPCGYSEEYPTVFPAPATGPLRCPFCRKFALKVPRGRTTGPGR
jgi:hypothetical protein